MWPCPGRSSCSSPGFQTLSPNQLMALEEASAPSSKSFLPLLGNPRAAHWVEPKTCLSWAQKPPLPPHPWAGRGWSFVLGTGDSDTSLPNAHSMVTVVTATRITGSSYCAPAAYQVLCWEPAAPSSQHPLNSLRPRQRKWVIGAPHGPGFLSFQSWPNLWHLKQDLARSHCTKETSVDRYM